MAKKLHTGIQRTPMQKVFRVIQYIVCIFLAILSLFPFVIMLVNATRSTIQIQNHPISFMFGSSLMNNIRILNRTEMFSAVTGLKNSFIISACATALTVYFSTLTAYALVAYEWKLKGPFFAFILGVMMIPATVTSIGFYQFMYRIHWTNSLLPLIIPAVAAPGTVFFMRQFMVPALPMEIVQSARVDGAAEFRTFNQIVLPIMKPAMATQAIFCFVGNWNNLFIPSILLTNRDKYTMPIMVSLLNGDVYKTEYGAIYLGILLTVLPIFVIYFALSKYIIAGVALGGVKE